MPNNDKLHALLAVEGDLKSKAEAILKETISVFKNKKDHFVSKNKVYEPINDDGIQFPPENKEMVTTVDDKVAYTQQSQMEAIDAILQKETTNTIAKADLIVEGVVLAENLPATALLNLEGRLKSVRAMYHAIPTLQEETHWTRNAGDKPGVFTAEEEVKYRTEKRIEPLILVPATDRHPAQVEKINKDVQIGKWRTITKSGVWTSYKKSKALERLDVLIGSVKKARQRANDTEVLRLNIGKKLFDFVHDGLPSEEGKPESRG